MTAEPDRSAPPHAFANRDSEESAELPPTSRLENLCDCVFSVVLTLLIFNLRLPPRERGPQEHIVLVQKLQAELPFLESYIVTFLLVGFFWVVHHAQFHAIQRADRTLVWLNIAFLMCLAFLPFTTSLAGGHPDDRLAVGLLGCNLILCSLAQALNWVWASAGRRLLNPGTDPRRVRNYRRRGLWTTVAFIFATALCTYNPDISLALFFIPVLVRTLT